MKQKLPPDVVAGLEMVQDGVWLPTLPPPEAVVEIEKRTKRVDGHRNKEEVHFTMTSEAFKQFVRRRMPPEIQEGAPQPATWEGSQEEWESLRQQAEDVEREKLAAEFATGIAVQGFTPEEMASGKLERGSVVETMTGKVKRPRPSTIPLELEAQARQMVKELAARRISMESVIQEQKLRTIAYGGWDGAIPPVQAVLAEARARIESYDFRQQSGRQEVDALPILNVLAPFHGPGGRDFVVGQEKISPELAERLTEWAQTTEAQAVHGRTLGSLGFGTWPVFRIENGKPPALAKAQDQGSLLT